MELFAHNGIEHATKTEAISHILATNVLTILIIVLGITLFAIGLQQLLRRFSKASVRITNRRQ